MRQRRPSGKRRQVKIPKIRHQKPKRFAGRVECPDCGREAEVVLGGRIYEGRATPEVAKKKFWACLPCGAWVGTHHKTGAPLGQLASRGLRQLRRRAHLAFDPIWKEGLMSRAAAYSWLQCQMNALRRVHIGQADEETCERVIELCERFRRAHNP